MKPKRAPNTWLVTLAAAGLALAFLFLVFLPRQKAIQALSDELCEKQEYAATAGSVAAAMEIARGELERSRAYNAAWKDSAPPEAELAGLFGKVNALASACGVTPLRFDPDSPVKMQRVCRVPVAVGCTGTFGQIASFLLELEDLPQTIWVDSLQLEAMWQSGDSVQCGLDLIIFADNPDDSDQAKLAG
jgi:Tfp pilus assembly protein PilO